MHQAATSDFARIAQDLQIRKLQVESVVQLLDEGNSVPFLARFRKERTGGLSEDVLRQIQHRLAAHRQFGERKQSILKSIENQGNLTDELRAAILGAETPKRLDDLYLPYKPKKKSPASAAREKGLDELAKAMWANEPAVADLDQILPNMLDAEKGLATIEDILSGVQHILAETIAETAPIRAAVRGVAADSARLISTKAENVPEGQGNEYKDYFQFSESVRNLPPHRVLALNRGEKEGTLKVRIEIDLPAARKLVQEKLPLEKHAHAALLQFVSQQALEQLILPGLEREIRKDLTERAQQHAIGIYAKNLRSLLLQPPLPGKRVLAIDPGFRNGCRLAALDEQGSLLGHAVVYPHAPQNRKEEARVKLEELIRAHQLNVVAIGNGTACRETEELVAELIVMFEQRRRGVLPADAAGSPTTSPGELAPAQNQASESASPAPPDSSGEGSGDEDKPPESSTAPAVADSPAETTPPEPNVVVEGVPEAATTESPMAVAPGPPPGPTSAQKRAAREQALAESKKALAGLPDAPADLAYLIVNEVGSHAYASSTIGREEFPDLDAPLRGTISIGRRLQDPLGELAKIDPPSMGVGLHPHDVNPRALREALEGVVESAVNSVGVDVNTAGVALLRYVSGLNPLVARDLVEHRKQHGPFKSRAELEQLPSIGPARYAQAAAFLIVKDGAQPFDRTRLHPESYAVATSLLEEVGHTPASLSDPEKHADLAAKLRALPIEEASQRRGLGQPTLADIIDTLCRPDHDPRAELAAPIFRTGMLKLEELQPGQELKGTVLNVVDFGAFVDIGLKDSGLVHISQMANRYIKSPYDVVLVGDVVTVWVLKVEQERRRVSLTMISPGTERKPPERRQGGRPPRGEQQPQGDRPAGEHPPGDRPAGEHPPGDRPPGDRGQRHRGRGRDRQPQGEPRPVEAPAAAPPTGEAGGAAAQTPAAQQAPPPRQDRQDRRGPPPQRRGGPPQQGGRFQGGQGGRFQGGGRGQRGGDQPRQDYVQPRRPAKPLPKPKLSKDALQGKAPLRTFGELTAFFDAKDKPPQPAPAEASPPPAAEQPPVLETPPAVEAASPPPDVKPPEAPPASDEITGGGSGGSGTA